MADSGVGKGAAGAGQGGQDGRPKNYRGMPWEEALPNRTAMVSAILPIQLFRHQVGKHRVKVHCLRGWHCLIVKHMPPRLQ